MDIGDLRPREKLLGPRRDCVGRDHAAGAVDNAVGGGIAADDIVGRVQNLRQTRTAFSS
jgi:hypothetical protein